MGQVAPFQLPYNIDSKEIINNKYVWQKTFSFNSDRRVIVKFDSNDFPEPNKWMLVSEKLKSLNPK